MRDHGTVFNIQKFSVNDGPGIRTTVFMKGCPLSCIWCHNPESRSSRPEIFYDARKCIGCGRCGQICENGCHSFGGGSHVYNREQCKICQRCAEECVCGAIESVGEVKSVSDVMREVLRDKPFYETSGGGMTLSGGEPMYQFDFTYSLLKAAKEEGLHTCIETCGFSSKENFRKIAPLVDIFLFDCKETDPEKHRQYTGVSNETILENLYFLDSIKAKIILRCPIIPGFNDRKEHLEKISEIANSLENILEINIEPYHPLGGGKSELLGKAYPLSDLGFMSDETVKDVIEAVSKKTDICVKKA